MKEEKQRTLAQNRALHLFFTQLADALNDKGQYISQVIKVDAQWDGDRIKELIWREVQKKITGKTSTTKLTSKEINDIFEALQVAFANKGIDIQWPSIETMMMEQRINDPRR